jgi:hypothetical protein
MFITHHHHKILFILYSSIHNNVNLYCNNNNNKKKNQFHTPIIYLIIIYSNNNNTNTNTHTHTHSPFLIITSFQNNITHHPNQRTIATTCFYTKIFFCKKLLLTYQFKHPYQFQLFPFQHLINI